MEFSSNEIRDYVSSTDFLRGYIYFEEGRVNRCLVKVDSKNKLLISSLVRGVDEYSQSILVTRDATLKIEGSCTCPVGHNCKHVIAACLAYIKNQKTTAPAHHSQEDEFELWLKEFNADKKSFLSGDYFVTYRLFGGERGRDELKFYKSKILKSGEINGGTLLDAYKFIDGYHYGDIKDESDVDIAQLSGGFFKDKYNTPIMKFSGTLGGVLLQNIIKTSRCYYNENKEPIRFAEGLFEPEFEFQANGDEYTLKSNIDKNYKLLSTKPPYILDIQNNTIMEFALDAKMFKKLQQAPKIPKQKIVQTYATISKNTPNIELKTPAEIKVNFVDAKPTPQLHLKSKSFKVDFDYDGFTLSYEPIKEVSSFFDKDEKVEIKRDLAFEADAKKRIESFGFESFIKDNDLWVELGDVNKQKQLKAFREFVESGLELLESEGWRVEDLDDFEMKFGASSEVVVESENENNWFSLSFNLEFDGRSIPIAPLVSSIIGEFDNYESMPESLNVEVDENYFVEVQTKQISPIIKTIIELMDKKDKNGKLKLSNFDAHMLASLDDDVIWKGSKEILELSKKLKDFDGIKKVEPSKVLNATLRDYQQQGLNWLGFLHEFKFGGILADDMGLGKTLQSLAHLSRLKEDNKLDKPSLIVMPTSLIANWKNEAKKFTPNLKVLSLHGNDRAERFDEVQNHDILLTTYQLILKDKEIFDKLDFSYIILDEAQKIKNPKTKMAMAIKGFKSDHRLALSGTPIENHLGELWSIFSFLMPGFLDTLSFFKNFYQTPIEKERF